MRERISERRKVIDILDKMNFFQGQRAGRELWNGKSVEVQEEDLENFNKDIRTIRDYILQLEATPVVRGEWKCIDEENEAWECSVCGKVWCLYGTPIDNGMNYCPKCGADMRKKVE